MIGRDDFAVLLDVDRTLIVSGKEESEIINYPLIEALKRKGISRVYLFTNMAADDIVSEVTSCGNYLSRPRVIEILNQHGIEVLGVITPADVSSDDKKVKEQKRLGWAYRTIFEPAHRLLTAKKDPVTMDNYATHPMLEIARERYRTLNDRTKDAAMEELKLLDPSLSEAFNSMPDRGPTKFTMLELFIRSKPKIKTIIIFDDNPDEIRAIEKKAGKLKEEYPGLIVECIRVTADRKAQDEAEYLDALNFAFPPSEASPRSRGSISRLSDFFSRRSTPTPEGHVSPRTPSASSDQSMPSSKSTSSKSPASPMGSYLRSRSMSANSGTSSRIYEDEDTSRAKVSPVMSAPKIR